MILLLLSCLNNLQANNNDTIPLRGSEHNDSLNVLIPIKNIRNANVKLIERKYLIQELNVKDSIIDLKNKYINIQINEINDYKSYISDVENINEKLNKKLKKYKKGLAISSGVTIAVTGSVLLYLFLK